MFRNANWLIVLAIAAALFLAGALGVDAATDQSEKSTGVVAPSSANEKAAHEKKLAESAEAAKRLLLLMDTNKSGKVSKQEWMKFMETEFDRLDVKHDGELDVKELTQSEMRYHPAVGK